MNTVKPITFEPFRYKQESNKGSETYWIDLLDHEGNGSCSCPDFEIRRQYNIKNGKPLYSSDTRCKHVNCAANLWAIQSLKFFSEILTKEGSSSLKAGALTLANQIHKIII